MKKAASSFAALSLLTLALAASCDNTPTRPSEVPPRITRVDIVAPSSLAPGGTTQLRLIARRSDGSAEDVTATARFSSSNRDVLAISPDGIATALNIGESVVGAATNLLYSTREVVVVPDGTFRVVGQVVEEDTPSLAVGGVRVEADGVSPVSTNLDGRYRLYGVPGHGRMRVSKNGYVTKELTLALSDHHTENVTLALAGPRLDVAGIYQLTIEAAPQCRGQIPDPLLTRQYAAAITQSGTAIQIRLSGANFVLADLAARIDQTGIALDFVNEPIMYGHCEASYAQFIEKIDDTTYVVIHGLARLLPAGAGFVGTLQGSSAIYSCIPCSFTCSNGAVAACASHRVTLAP